MNGQNGGTVVTLLDPAVRALCSVLLMSLHAPREIFAKPFVEQASFSSGARPTSIPLETLLNLSSRYLAFYGFRRTSTLLSYPLFRLFVLPRVTQQTRPKICHAWKGG
jgi:hypothetical protein